MASGLRSRIDSYYFVFCEQFLLLTNEDLTPCCALLTIEDLTPCWTLILPIYEGRNLLPLIRLISFGDWAEESVES